MHYVITAGGTREYLDPVRYISNASTGHMGYALAEAALTAGHNVTLVSASVALNPPPEATLIPVVSARDMWEAVKRTFAACDCLVMAAAVSDYTPAHPSTVKIKKGNSTLILELTPTTDILAWAAHQKGQKQRVIGFALEDHHLRENAEKKLKEKKLDMIIANDLRAVGATHTDLHIKTPHADWITLADKDKPTHARSLIQLIDTLLQP